MGNSESVSRRNRESSYSGVPACSLSYNKTITQNSLSDFDEIISNPPILLEELSEEEKFKKNKDRLQLSNEYLDLEYGLKYFLQQQGQDGSTSTLILDSKNSQLWEMKDSRNRYEGTFRNGQLYGQGIYFYPSGSIYMGGIKSNGREGQGVFYFTNGNIYSGTWSNNEQNGFGTFFFVSGSAPDRKVVQSYVGEFANSLFNGFGCYSYEMKYYLGYWKDDKYHGHGKVVTHAGVILKCGMFIDDQLVEELSEDKIVLQSDQKKYLPDFQQEINQKFQQLLGNMPIV